MYACVCMCVVVCVCACVYKYVVYVHACVCLVCFCHPYYKHVDRNCFVFFFNVSFHQPEKFLAQDKESINTYCMKGNVIIC